MRQAALLAAQCALDQSADTPIAPRDPWPGRDAEWSALAAEVRQIGVSASDWVAAAAAAAELHPEVAAAFSILAENERLALPTPAALARIAATGLGISFDAMLAACLASSPLLEQVAPAGHAVPAAQTGLKLTLDGLAVLFGQPAGSEAELVPARHPPVFARAARATLLILHADGAVWIRGRSRRMARQLALDVGALLPGQAVSLAVARADAPLPDLRPGEALVVLDLFDLDRAPQIGRAGSPRAVIAPERFEHPAFRAVDAPTLGPAEAATVWSRARLPECERAPLEQRFRLTMPELREAEAEAETLAALKQPTNGAPPAPPDGETLAQAIRAAGARRMGPSVTTVATAVTLDDLVATPAMRSQLEDVAAWRRNDARVWGEMRVPADAADARGLAVLFSGPPGGGKTFAARCLANTLGLNLYRIDLSQVVSKYIGETEKRLAQVFDEAEAGHGILFFDEADAVFGKRSEVKDAHDRYANIEVGFLLQRMESFGGVVVLATNLRCNLEPAFLRRLQFVIDFPMPGRAERALLWERNLPGPEWRGPDLDVDDLAARFRLAGGNIRNATVAAAHLAAEDRAPIGMRHLARALYRELEKSGHPRGQTELGGLAEHLEGLA